MSLFPEKSFMDSLFNDPRQPSSVTKAINRLERECLVFRDSQGYEFFSPFFRSWILSHGLKP